MINKASRSRKYVTDIYRESVISLYLSDNSISGFDIALKLGISQSSVCSIIKQYINENNLNIEAKKRTSYLQGKQFRRYYIYKNHDDYDDDDDDDDDFIDDEPDLQTIIETRLRGDIELKSSGYWLKGRPVDLTRVMQEVNRRMKSVGLEQYTINPAWEVL